MKANKLLPAAKARPQLFSETCLLLINPARRQFHRSMYFVHPYIVARHSKKPHFRVYEQTNTKPPQRPSCTANIFRRAHASRFSPGGGATRHTRYLYLLVRVCASAHRPPPGESKVGYPQLAVLGHQHVARLQVPVNNAVIVQKLPREKELRWKDEQHRGRDGGSVPGTFDLAFLMFWNAFLYI